MKEISSPVSYKPRFGHFVSLSKHSDAIHEAHLRLDRGKTGIGTARLGLWPADDIEQAKSFFRSINITELRGLKKNGWSVESNLHFGGPFGRGWPPYVYKPPAGLDEYIKFWRAHPEYIRSFDRSEISRRIHDFQRRRLMPRRLDKEDVRRLGKFKKVGVRPGLQLTFKWPPFRIKLPDPKSFAPAVIAKVDEALKTWGDTFA
jgi:hypothetical protein